MKRSIQPSTSLTSLPPDLLSKILSHAGENSREDVRNGIFMCKALGNSAADIQVFKSLELRDIVKCPLLALRKYAELFQKCLLHSNPAAHYIKGLLEYLRFDNPIEGLKHLKEAADATVPVNEALYLYGTIMLCTGHYNIGKHYMDRLRWMDDKALTEQCWKNIMISVHGIGIITKPEYMTSLWAMMPPYVCNINDMDNTCEKCFHYKQMIKFIFTI
ncbi:unnamed protein product [Thlaspi arvense]|uniref:At2g35280-like TPR domain-containing protein n=1 Tax=Thlaspi arvense TaxID=13288 RepID=A0AAU9R873_THLAR|nr:unnamed protein product [Thlaspi arvense]